MSNTNNANNVTAGKPKIGGAVYRAPKGTTLPTDATSALAAEFKCLGYCSEDGLSNGNDRSNSNVAAWGGDVVLNMTNAGSDTFTLTLIETLNEEVLKTVYGSDEESVYVFELILKDGALKRIVVPCASVTALGEIKYIDTDAVGYNITLTAVNDSKGNSHYEYIHLKSE